MCQKVKYVCLHLSRGTLQLWSAHPEIKARRLDVEGRLIALYSLDVLNLTSSKCGYVRLGCTKPLSAWHTHRQGHVQVHAHICKTWKKKTTHTHTAVLVGCPNIHRFNLNKCKVTRHTDRHTYTHTPAKPTTKCHSSIQSDSPETQSRAPLSQDRES